MDGTVGATPNCWRPAMGIRWISPSVTGSKQLRSRRFQLASSHIRKMKPRGSPHKPLPIFSRAMTNWCKSGYCSSNPKLQTYSSKISSSNKFLNCLEAAFPKESGAASGTASPPDVRRGLPRRRRNSRIGALPLMRALPARRRDQRKALVSDGGKPRPTSGGEAVGIN